jgi:Zn ribbon nucleic-acid-binding protein
MLENHEAKAAEQTQGPRTALNARVAAGWQCPECYGVRIETRRIFASDRVEGFTCTECGCQFGSRK